MLNLGFVLAGEGAERVAAAVAPLSQSFNPHVRYGAAMALGVGCACGGARPALDALAPLLADPVDFVRQGALIAQALVLMQQPAARGGPAEGEAGQGVDRQARGDDVQVRFFLMFFFFFLKFVRESGKKEKNSNFSLKKKLSKNFSRMGAIMATGIVDAGGRNARVELLTPGGRLRKTTAVGLAMFVQYWYWYPLSYFFGVALTPGALIAVEPKHLKTPETRAGLRVPGEPVQAPGARCGSHDDDDEKDRGGGAVDDGQGRCEGQGEGEGQGDQRCRAPMDEGDEDKKKEDGDGDDDAKQGGKEEPDEPSHYLLHNPTRVAPAQARFVRWPKAGGGPPCLPRGAAPRRCSASWS